MNIPCYKCDRRQVGCHSTCEDYGEFRENNLKRYDENLKKAEVEEVFVGKVIKRREKAKKRYKR